MRSVITLKNKLDGISLFMLVIDMFQRLSRKDQKKIRLHLKTLPILLIYSDSCLYHDYNSTI